jgi:tRNA threonylcarbamoyladenosine modification (KEOPS) complex  Pcc1 subunit
MLTAEIVVKGEKAFLKACHEALKPEEEFKTERAGYDMHLGNDLKINVKAEDATAFRAVTTTLTGLLSVIEKGWKHGR